METHSIRDASSLRYVTGLDGLRAISMMLVVLFHYTSYFSSGLSELGGAWSGIVRIASTGWIGVDVFFVISGFLITTTLLKRPVNSVASYAKFIQRRAVRLLPAYVASLLIFTLVALLIDPHSKVLKNEYLLWTFTASLQSLFGDRVALADQHFTMAHFWTLAVEWHFYIVFPILVARFHSYFRPALALLLVAISFRVACHFAGISDNGIYTFTLCRIDSIAVGCLLALVPSHLRFRQSAAAGVLGAAMFMAIWIALACSNVPFKTLAWLQTFGYTLLAVSVALMIYRVIHSSPRSPIVRALEFKPLASIGRASYSLYIWHVPFYPAIALLAQRNFADIRLAYLVAVAAGVVVTAALGGLSYLLVESRFTRARPPVLA
ncbi:peptidoglycan/LPS O-acetylase OafA/YrhL [Paraburkholderia sp. BL6665CI2N2]|uniref:acyltransferase family protein n=1 Tax=Paraburkholderia sp. BL6665CI2N2 TaxID=1938806 RepID=UPI0010658D60|nr:acyltransferase [Paraburkholderia sp. BL6665CI2N2]TDY25999.1 peptidoglycan/LPS O-acetylase OafA/YrhL [Paraburkholderia sp. BL6665CI2N2]